MFTEECYSISFHPSGLHVLCGFSDKLRLMNLLMDDIRPCKEFAIKACRECRFSVGGQSFAAVNGNTIQIYSTYTCENIYNLRGHNGKVKSIYWTQDDTKLVSAGAPVASRGSPAALDKAVQPLDPVPARPRPLHARIHPLHGPLPLPVCVGYCSPLQPAAARCSPLQSACCTDRRSTSLRPPPCRPDAQAWTEPCTSG